jgi:CheY-like chemotaxis protein
VHVGELDAQAPMNSIDPVTWLVAEDDENDFLLLKRAFKRAAPHTKLQWVKDGLEAKKYLLGEAPFDDRSLFPLPSIILTDLKMPRCSGLELLAWLKTQPQLQPALLIVFTSSNVPSDEAAASALGAHLYFTKPATSDQLVEMLRRMLGQAVPKRWRNGTSASQL